MIQFPSFPHRKIFLTALMLVIVSLAVLLAQNAPSSKEAAPARTGQRENIDNAKDVKLQTFNEEEYLVYQKSNKIMLLNPTTMREEVSTKVASVEEFFKQGAFERLSLFNFVRWSAYGSMITETKNNDGLFKTTASSPGVNDFILDQWIDLHGKRTTYRNVMGWLDKTHIVVSKGNLPYAHDGVFILDISTGKEDVILSPLSYVETPSLSPSGRYLFYKQVRGGKFNGGDEYNDILEGFVYDFKTGKTFKIDTDSGWLFGWTTTKEISQGPGEPGFFSPTVGCSPNLCLHPNNSVTYKLPFKCGTAYVVTRDGNCNTPADCNLGDGGYPVMSGYGVNNHHDNKRALDFIRVTNANAEMPVYAAAAGQVIKSGWQGSTECIEAAGYGYHVAIKHTDGTCTIYGHLKDGSGPTLGSQVSQGQQIGIEWYTGHTFPCGSGGRHIHFERRIWLDSGGLGSYGSHLQSYWMEFDELGPGQIPVSGHMYISQNGSCSMPCVNGGTLPACGGYFTGQSTNILNPNTRATYFVTTSNGGNLASTNMSGPEKVYQITPSITGLMSVKLTNSSNLNIVILTGATCSNINTLLHCTGTAGTSSNSYTASCNVTAGNTYYVVVDGIDGASGSYNLTVNTPCLPNLTEYGSSMSSSGRNVSITAKVANDGTGNAGPFHTRYVLSIDPAFGNDYVLATVNYSNGLPAGYYSTFPFTVTASTNIPAGTYYVLFHFDYLYAVTESNENDNAYYFNSVINLPSALTNGGADERSIGVLAQVEVFDDGTMKVLELVETDLSNVVQIQESTQIAPVQVFCTATVSGYKVTSSAVFEGSSYVLANSLGQVICSGKSQDGIVECEVPNSGIYFLSIIDGAGNKCTQKIFVN